MRISGRAAAAEETEAFARVAAAQGYAPLSPMASRGVHPLVIPVARMDAGTTSNVHSLMAPGGDVLGLYYDPTPAEDKDQRAQPQPGQDPMQAGPKARILLPVVRYRRGGTEGAAGDHIELIASSMRQYVHMALVSEAMAMEPAGEGVEPRNGSVAAAAGSVGLNMCDTAAGLPDSDGDGESVRGELRRIAGLRRISMLKADMYMLQKVGKLPMLLERLTWQHMAKSKALDASLRGKVEDTGATSALVTSDLYMRSSPAGWARPYVFAAEQLMMLGRREEARDMCRVALRQPWYTFGAVSGIDSGIDGVNDVFKWVTETADYTSNPDELFDRLRDEDARAQDPKCSGAGSPEPFELAMHLINRTSVLERSSPDSCIYDGVRGKFSELLELSGYQNLAAYVQAAVDCN